MRLPRVLFEVASLEREAGLQHEACLRHLAAAVRVSHKVHAFAGGFEPEQSQLFDKVRYCLGCRWDAMSLHQEGCQLKDVNHVLWKFDFISLYGMDRRGWRDVGAGGSFGCTKGAERTCRVIWH